MEKPDTEIEQYYTDVKPERKMMLTLLWAISEMLSR